MLYSFLSRLLFGRLFFLLLFYRVHVDGTQMFVFGQKFVQRVRWVDGCILFGGIFARVLEDDLGPAWMLYDKLLGQRSNKTTDEIYQVGIRSHRRLCRALSPSTSLWSCALPPRRPSTSRHQDFRPGRDSCWRLSAQRGSPVAILAGLSRGGTNELKV